MSKRIDGYHVELIDGFIRKNIVDYVFPTHDDTYGNSGYTYEGLISDVCSPVVPAINIIDCYSDCARLIGKEEQIPQGYHQASSAEANAFREEMGSYMGTLEIAELTDAQFMGSSYNLEIKMEINPKYDRIGIVRDYIPRCTHYDVLVEKKRFHGESLPEGFHVANSVEAIKYLAEFMSKRIDGYHVELIDGFIRNNVVDYVFPTNDDTYGNSGYTYEGLISDVCSPVVPAINIVDCYSDCAKLIGKGQQIPQGFHQASSAEANAFREEMGSYMGTSEIAELTDAQFMGSSYNLEIKMTLNPWFNRIGIVRDYIPTTTTRAPTTTTRATTTTTRATTTTTRAPTTTTRATTTTTLATTADNASLDAASGGSASGSSGTAAGGSAAGSTVTASGDSAAGSTVTASGGSAAASGSSATGST